MKLGKPFNKKLNQSFSVKTESENALSLTNMLENLLNLCNFDWGYYEFARDLIGHKFTNNEKKKLIVQCEQLVDDLVCKYKAEYPMDTPEDIANKLGLKVFKPDLPDHTAQIIFGEFVDPNKIYIYQEPIKKFREWVIGDKNELKIFQNLDLNQTIIAHELFHYIEEMHRDSILTRTFRKELWKLGPFSNRSQVKALSEYSAKIFSQKLTRTNESVYLLEVILIYFYDTASARRIYQQILNSMIDRRIF